MAYKFINPYNFIPLGNSKKKAEEPEKKPGLSGVISYSLLTKTPLFIPNTSNDNAFDMEKMVEGHKSYDFFSYKDLSSAKGSVKNELPRPVIPGSEMRGMLRSNYEILTDSCMSAVDDDQVLSKRTQEKFKAGLLKRKEAGGKVTYELYEAEDCLVRTKGANTLEDESRPGVWSDEKGKIKCKDIWGRQCYRQDQLSEGSEVAFHIVDRGKCKTLAFNVKKTSKTSARFPEKIGYVIKGEPGPEMKSKNGEGYSKQNKHCLHVFCQSDKQDPRIKVLGKGEMSEDDLTSRLDVVLAIYKQNAKEENKECQQEGENSTKSVYKEYLQEYQKFKEGNGNDFFPVYYSVIEYGERKADGLMLAPACITREVYSRKISDMAKTHESCEKSGKLCPACALFGTLKKENKGSVTSRIRVTDLECMERDPERCFNKEPVTLQPLSAPKFNPEFYIQKPNGKAVFWTYEYYVDQNGDVHKFPMKFNGRKFYWHHPNFSIENCKGEKVSNQNKTIRPLKEGITFRGKIYFQNISEKELNTLCYLINAGESSDIVLEEKKYGYKLGAAKPLGLGSVAMHVDEVLLRKFTINEEGISLIEEMYTPDMDNTLADQNVTGDYANMTNFDCLKHCIQSGNAEISYPRIKKDGDIFEWFAKNHTGYDHKKKKEQPMPSCRKNMVFKEYLKPMTPEVTEVESTKRLLSGQNGNRQNRNKNEKKSNNRGGNSYKKKR